MMNNERDTALDVLKGFLMACIVFVHVSKGACAIEAWFNTFKLAGFFLISGYLVACRPVSMRRRVCKIMVSYFLFSAFAILFRLALNLVFGTKRVFVEFDVALVETFSLSGYLTLWFLPVLALGEIILLAFTKKKQMLVALLVLSMGIVVLYPSCLKQMAAANICFRVVGRTLPAVGFLVAGFLLEPLLLRFENADKKYLLLHAVILVVLGFVCSLFAPGVQWVVCDFGRESLAFLLAAASSSLGLLLFFKVMCRYVKLPWLAWIGKNSLFIMVVHFAVPFIFFSQVLVELVFGSMDLRLRNVIVCILVLLMQYPCVVVYNLLRAKARQYITR